MADKPNTTPPLRVSYEHAQGTKESTQGSELSLGGVFIETAATLPVGSLLTLEIESGRTSVTLDARILSRRGAEGPGRPAGLAVSFIDLPNDAASSLHSILAARAPRKGTMLGLGEAEDDIPTYQSERKLPVAASPSKAEGTPPAKSPTPTMPMTDAEALPAPEVARPAPAMPAPAPAPAPAMPAPAMPAPAMPAPAAVSPSWAPSPAPVVAPSVAPAPAAAPFLPVPPRRENRNPVLVVVLAVVLLVAIAIAAWLVLRTLR
jgi:hypothetical protein